MARTQQAKPDVPAAVKTAAAKSVRVHKVPKGAVTGPKGKNMPEPTEQQPVVEEQRKGERRQQQSTAMAQFAASSMTTPAVHEPTEEEKKKAQLLEQVTKLAQELGIDPSTVLNNKPAKAPKADKTQRNGITRPAAGTTCAKIWDLADKISHDQQGHPALISQLKAAPEMKQINDHTLKTQYARWRNFHGIKGRVQLVPKPEQEGSAQPTEAAE